MSQNKHKTKVYSVPKRNGTRTNERRIHIDNKNNDSSRSWFCVLNNPQNFFGDIEPLEMVEKAIDMWIENKPQRACAINYEIGDSGTPHMHIVLEDPAKTRFSSIKKLYGDSIHIEKTRGNKKQAMEYITKKGQFEEKNHTVIIPAQFYGEIKAVQGARNDLYVIQEMIEQGMTPVEIMNQSIVFRKHSTIIKSHYFEFRKKQTPILRDVTVYWHTGNSGCGKSYTFVKLCEKYGRDKIFHLTDYGKGGFDEYCAEPILFMDEFKGNLPFHLLLNYLDTYVCQIPCRYANGTALWNEVHITSIFTPHNVYKKMVDESSRGEDKLDQLLRRIDYLVYHYKDENGNFCESTIPMSEFTSIEDIQNALKADKDGFIPITQAEQLELPFLSK